MENSYCYFKNTKCEYFPCHTEMEDFNCLFCYCPLYSMEDCLGVYEYVEVNGKKVKSCKDCIFPHVPENYNKMIEILKKAK